MKMKGILKKLDKSIFIIIISVTIMLSHLFLRGAILGHDSLTHMFRIVSLSQNIVNGDIFGKIGFNYINGYGYATGIFYPQFNLYLSAIIYSFIKNVSIALKVYIYFNTILAGIIMHRYLKRKVKSNTALIGSLIYVLSPYCYIQSMFRGAIGEMAIFVSLPLIFWGVDKIINREKYGNLFVIMGGINILQSHIISTVYVCVFILIYLLLNYNKILNRGVIIDLIKAFILIILLSLYFLIPLIEHYKIGGYNILNGKDDPSSSIIYFSQLFFHNGQNAGNVDGPEISEELSYVISILIVGINICLPYVYSNMKKDKKAKDALKYLFMGIIPIFMMCCPFVWGHFDIFDKIQFPWRLLSFVVFFLSISGSYIFDEFKIGDNQFPVILFCFLIVSFIQLNNYIVNTPTHEKLDFDLYSITSKQIIDNENKYLFKALGGANDYLPAETTIDYIINRGSSLVVVEGKLTKIDNYKIEKGKLSAYIEASKNTKVELPFIYYLGYSVKLNNNKISYYKNKNGFIEINLNNEISGILTVEYNGTIISRISNYISIITLIILVFYYLFFIKKIKVKC